MSLTTNWNFIQRFNNGIYICLYNIADDCVEDKFLVHTSKDDEKGAGILSAHNYFL